MLCTVVSSAAPSVSSTALQNHRPTTEWAWKCCSNSTTLRTSTNSIAAVAHMMLQPFVPCMWGAAPGYWHVCRIAPLEKYWFVYFTACIRLHLTRQSAGTESKWHSSMTYPLPHQSGPSQHVEADWQGLCSRVWDAEGWGSPGDRRRGNKCRGDQHALGACWALRV